jgi:hypothetical protein
MIGGELVTDNKLGALFSAMDSSELGQEEISLN